MICEDVEQTAPAFGAATPSKSARCNARWIDEIRSVRDESAAMRYDLCDPSIRCNADKFGAEVFEVEVGRKVVRVLTFSQEEAEQIARSEQERPVEADHQEFLL